MEELKFTVEAGESGLRIDRCIALRLGEDYSRTLVKTLIDDRHVTVNGKEVKAHYLSKERDEVHVKFPPPEKSELEPEDIPIKVIYEDKAIIVVDKPAGLVVHPGSGNKKGTLVNALLYHCKGLPEADDRSRPGIVHRLDKDTSGVIVVAKNDKAMRSLAKQFQKRAVKKRYVALVKGVVEFDNGVIDAPIGRHETRRETMDVVDEEDGRHARTVYHVVKRFPNFTLLSIELETGRTHQIRVHMKHIGHPVLGDTIYGKKDGLARQALHAEMLGFTHPETSKYVEFVSPLPKDIKEVIDRGKI